MLNLIWTGDFLVYQCTHHGFSHVIKHQDTSELAENNLTEEQALNIWWCGSGFLRNGRFEVC